MQTKQLWPDGFVRLGLTFLCGSGLLAVLFWLMLTGSPAPPSTASGAADAPAATPRAEAARTDTGFVGEPALEPPLPAPDLPVAMPPLPAATEPDFHPVTISRTMTLSLPSSNGNARAEYSGLLPAICLPDARDDASCLVLPSTAARLMYGPSAPALVVTVDTTSVVLDGALSSVSALIANPGPDGRISFNEALLAVNRDYAWNGTSGHTIRFSPSLDHGARIGSPWPAYETPYYVLEAPNTTIDGDTNGDDEPDILIQGIDGWYTLVVVKENNTIRNLAIGPLGIVGQNAYNNTVRGCHLGVGVDGTTDASSGDSVGVEIGLGAHYNLIVDNVIAGNTFAGDDKYGIGIVLYREAHDNNLQGNLIGLDIYRNRLSNEVGVLLTQGAYDNTIGGERSGMTCDTAPCNLISGNGTGVQIEQSGTVNNMVLGNYIGVDLAGASAISNTWGIVIANGAARNTIGGDRAGVDCTGPCNLISGNGEFGVVIEETGSANNTVLGNYIGVDIGGATALANRFSGIILQDGASGNTIGGERQFSECSGPCNVIGGSGQVGVLLYGSSTMSNTVQGNYIGVNATGMAAISNAGFGVALYEGASRNLVGGARSSTVCNGPCNLISGNGQDGVLIAFNNAAENRVQGNYIGLNRTGADEIPNGEAGLTIYASATKNVIGGPRTSDACTGPCNIIGGNGWMGVAILSTTAQLNVVQGNYIGLGTELGLCSGNEEEGVYIYAASDNTIGGTQPNEGNMIACNGEEGIQIVRGEAGQATNGNALRYNRFWDNSMLPIDLAPMTGVGVAADGPNNRRHPPALQPPQVVGGAYRIAGTTDAPAGSHVDIYGGGGRYYLATAAVVGEAFSVTLPVGTVITRPIVAMVTDSQNNSSELSGNGALYLSTPNALPGGRIYAFGVITDLASGRLITTASGVTITLYTGNDQEDLPLHSDGQAGDFFRDAYYSGWFTAPITAASYEIEMTWNDVTVAVATLKVIQNPQLVVLTDLQALRNEFIQTSSVADAHTIYTALQRMARYAGDHQGVVIDARQAITRTSSTVNTPYAHYDYQIGTAERTSMGVAIDNYIQTLDRYRATLRYLAIVGDDAVIPSFRRSDPLDATCANPNEVCEREYPAEVDGAHGNPTLVDSGARLILTDVPYASFDATDPNRVLRPAPNMAVGRIFHATPQGLTALFQAYETPLNVTAADQVAVGLHQKNDRVAWRECFERAIVRNAAPPLTLSNIPTGTTLLPNQLDGDTLYRFNGFQSNWTSASVIEAVENGALVVLYSHADQRENNTQVDGDDFEATDLANVESQPGALFINAGCHAGYPVVSLPAAPAANRYGQTFSPAFLNRQIAYLAPTVYGFGDDDSVEFHDRLYANFLNRINNAAVCSIGDAFLQAQNLFNSQVNAAAWVTLDTYTRYGTAFYGLPTQRLAGRCPPPAGGAARVASVTGATQTVALQATTTAHTVDVVIDTPHFQVVTDADGALRFELQNTGGRGGAAHYPVLPQVVRAYMLPAGAAVTAVTLTGQVSHTVPGTATLATVTPVNRTYGPLPGRETLTQTYPAQIFWHGASDFGNSVLLLVGVNPLQYDPATQQVTLYTHVTLRVAYEAPASATTITAIAVNGGAPVDVGAATLPLQATLDHVAAPQAMLLDWQISGVDGRPLRSGRQEVYLTSGSNTVDWTTDTLDWPPGPALLAVTIGSQDAALDASATLLTARGRSLAAAADQPYYNSELTATVSAAVHDETGAAVTGLSAALTATLDGAPLVLAWGETGSGAYQAPLALGGLAEGYHTLFVGLPGSTHAEAGLGIDHTPPTATLQAPLAGTADLAIPIRWSGYDDGAGIDHYDIQYAINSPPWTDWFTASAELDYLLAHSTAFFGPWAPVTTTYTTTYCFRIRAVDRVGNVGVYPADPGNGCTGTFVNPPVDHAEAVARVVELTNQARAAHGLPPLSMSSLLNDAAQVQTDDMAANSFHDHVGSDGSTPADRIYRAGYEGSTTGENVACGAATPEELVDGWMNSPGHRANILNPDYREIGIGYTFDPVSIVLSDGCGYHFWAQTFGARETVYPVVINGEAEVTSSPLVTLTIYGAGWASDMLVSNNADFSGASWQPYASPLPWTLAPASGQGTRTVYVRLRNALGETLDAQDEIILNCCALRGADLRVVKIDLPDPVMVQEPLTYTLVVANDGPLGAAGVMLFDTLPTGLEYQGYETTAGFCTYAAGTISCRLGEMDSGARVTVTLTTRVATTAAGSLTNVARVTSYESDPNVGNNAATSTTSVRGSRADLAVLKSDSTDPVGIGAPLTYTIVVANAGPAAATAVVLTDTLPLNVIVGPIAPSQGSCGRAGNVITCALGSIPAGSTVTLTVAVTTTAAGTLTNTAVVDLSGDQLDPNPADNRAVEQTQVSALLIVNSTGDAVDSHPGDAICQTSGGVCTLRAALQEANAQPGLNVIVFDIPGGGPHTIQPASALPTIGDPVLIDGSSEPDYAGTPVVELDGSGAGADVDGLTITAGGSTVRGLAINRFDSDGIWLVSGGGNVVEGCFVGTDPGGTSDLGNGESGIRIYQSANNVIGGATAAARNLIAGNGSYGLWIDGSNSPGNLIQGNYIGTDFAGALAIGNATGIYITDATSTTVRSNLISGNTIGVHIAGRQFYATSGNVITANMIGTNAAGDAALNNSSYGVYLDTTSYNTIGGALPADGNLISGNGGDGIYIAGSTSFGHVIRNNTIGANAAGSAALGNVYDGVRIGTDDGTFWQMGGWQHVIADNLISANGGVGILLTGSECQIENNRIGTDATGTLDLGNGHDGLFASSASNNTIRANLVSGNGGHGIFFDVFSLAATANVIQGNRVGVNAAGNAAIGNDGIGIYLSYASGNRIGGTGAGEGNLISGNGGGGIGLGATHDNVVQGNRVGTNAAGTAALGNTSAGIGVSDFSLDNLIGGTDAGAGNLVSGNVGDGISIAGESTRIEGNWIGVDATGTAPLGNSDDGVEICCGMAVYNTVGGTAGGAGNVIAFNGGAGVALSFTAARNAILSNQVYSNTGLGIDLGDDGVTANDPGDGDTGENALQNYPVLTLAVPVAEPPGGTLVRGMLSSAAGTTYTLQFFSNTACDPTGYGEGAELVGSTVVTSDVAGDAAFDLLLSPTLPTGAFVSATATDPDGNTSEFSACALVAHWADLAVTKSGEPAALLSGETLTYTLVVSNTGPSATTGTLLTDTLPGSMTFASALSSQGSCTGTGVVVCDLGGLAVGGRATVTLVVTPTLSGAWVNTATVAADQPDPEPLNDTATLVTPVDPADLVLSKTAWPDSVSAGAWLTYTLVITNGGPLTATGIVLTDTLPPGTVPTATSLESFEGGAVPPSGWSEENQNTAKNWTISTSPYSGSYSAYVPRDYNQNEWLLSPYLAGLTGGMTTTAWSAGSTYWCRDFYNNCDLNAWLVVGDAGGGDDVLLGVLEDDWVANWTWSHSTLTLPATLPSGDLRIGFQYVGDDGADAYLDEVVLPGTPNTGSATPSQGTCTLGDTTTCSLGTLASGATATVTLVVRPSVAGTLVNTATVTAHEPDPTAANNVAVETTIVGGQVDLGLLAWASSAQAWHGEPLTYTLVVSNGGPQTATNVRVVDDLPDDVTFLSADPAVSCSHVSGVVSCGLGSVAAGARVTVTVAVTPTFDWSQVRQSALNLASVSSNDADGDSSNNEAWLRTPVYMPGDENWDIQFSPPGVDGKVVGVAIDGSDVYVVGLFENAGGTSTSYLAHWDGSAWHEMASSVTRSGTLAGTLYAVAAHDGLVYIGGQFNTITALNGDVVSANNVAMWDGTDWHALGSGTNTIVRALAVDDSGALYAGGEFSTAGGVTVNGVAQWDGSAWAALGSGIVNGSVYALAVDGGDVYAGGSFYTGGGAPGNYVAHWDGATWSSVGSGADGTVYALAVDATGDLYAGGDFYYAGGVTVLNVAMWDGSAWSALGSGVNNPVRSLVASGGDLYAGGQFTAAGGKTVNRIARWDGSAWHDLDGGLPGGGLLLGVYALAADQDGDVYAGGDFKIIGGRPAWNIARWDGADWSPLVEAWGGNGLDTYSGASTGILASVISGNDVYAGGDFSVAGNTVASAIARWDGSDWHALGGGITGTVYALAASATDLYAGGIVYGVSTLDTTGIARWDIAGQNWHALGGGTGSVYAIAIAPNDDVYVGGSFWDVDDGNVAAYNVARWDGSQWHALSNDLYDSVYAIAISGTQVYVGGRFSVGGGSPANRIAMWDGSTWHALGSGVDGTVHAIAIADNGDVYVGGEFWTAGGVAANGIARWDGSTWHALGSGVQLGASGAGVYAIVIDGSDVTVGGQFNRASGLDVNNVAVWDGSGWSSLGSGIVAGYGPTARVRTIAPTERGVYVGGWIKWAGRHVSSMWGRWMAPTPDLRVTQSDAPDPAASGAPLTYTVIVANAGSLAATGVVLTDTLPGSVTFGSATPSQGSCSGTSVVVCELGSIDVDAQAQVTLVVTPTAAGAIENHATAMARETDRALADNSAVESTLVDAIDLAVAKVGSADPVIVGATLVYTVTVANLGPATATGVVLTDTLPSGAVLGSATPSQGTCAGSGPLVCNLGVIANGGSATVIVTLAPTVAGTARNTATVAANEPDANAANDTAIEETLVEAWADLGVTKAVQPGTVRVGEALVYTVTVSNAGPSAATGIVLTDTLPGGVSLGSAVPSQGICWGTGPLVCTLGTIASGSSAAVTIVVTPATAGTLENAVTAAADEPDPNSANNAASVTKLVAPAADLGVTQVDSADPVLVGARLVYTVSVTNHGPSAATGVTLVDTLPAGVLLVSATPSQGTCGESGGVVTCALGSLDGGAATVTVVVTPTQVGVITNTAAVAAAEYDANPANNSTAQSTSILPVADLALSQSGAPDPAYVGAPLIYTVVVANRGPSGATQVTLSDTLPVSVTFGAATSSQGTCAWLDGLVTCNLGALSHGASATVTIGVTPTAIVTLTNAALVTAGELDPDAENNLVSIETAVSGWLAFQADFTGGLPASWMMVNGGIGLVGSGTWTTANTCNRALPGDGWVMVDSDCAGMGESQDEQLISPPIDTTGCGVVELTFGNQFRSYGDETADVDVSTDDGATWNNVLRLKGSDAGYPAPETRSVDIGALAAGQTIRVRFHYYNAHYDWWWAVRDVEVTCRAAVDNAYRYVYLPVVLRNWP